MSTPRLLDKMRRSGLPADSALLVLLVHLRGGQAPSDEVDAEWMRWVDQYGEPTWGKLGLFAAGKLRQAVQA